MLSLLFDGDAGAPRSSDCLILIDTVLIFGGRLVLVRTCLKPLWNILRVIRIPSCEHDRETNAADKRCNAEHTPPQHGGFW